MVVKLSVNVRVQSFVVVKLSVNVIVHRDQKFPTSDLGFVSY